MADFARTRAIIRRSVALPFQAVMAALGVLTAILAWRHVIDSYWAEIGLVVVVLFWINTMWELHKESRKPIQSESIADLILRADRHHDLRPLVEHKRTGDLLWQRCPHETISTYHGATEQLLAQIDEWKVVVGNALDAFPEDQVHWNGGVTIARGDDDADSTTQDVSKHVLLLTAIICQHVEREDSKNVR